MLASEAFLDFIHISAPRAGSAWMRTVLAEHPEVSLARRPNGSRPGHVDPYLAALDSDAGLDAYRALFDGASPYTALGDTAPGCRTDPFAAGRLARRFPDAKVLVFLRDPVDMLHSLHCAARERGEAPGDLMETIAARPDWLEAALYHRWLVPFFDAFSSDQICIVIYERFFVDEAIHLSQLLRFLEVDEDFRPSVMGYRVNERRNRRSGLRRRLTDLLAPQPMARPWQLDVSSKFDEMNASPTISEEARSRICSMLDGDLQRLEVDLGLDLSHWRKRPEEPVPAIPDNVIHLPRAVEALRRRRLEALADA